MFNSLTASSRLIGIDPGKKVFRTKLGKAQQKIAEISLGIDRDHRNSIDRRLFEQANSETCLAAASHPNTDSMRREMLRLVEKQFGSDLAMLQVVGLAEVKQPELLKILRRFHDRADLHW